MQKTEKLNLQKIVEPIKGYLEEVNEEIEKRLNTGIDLVDECALHLFKRGGKKIRASLIILSSGLKNQIPENIATIAAAAEIVHAATLVHDDIIDKSSLRRGELTVSNKWGNKIAVLAGDFMYTRALEIAVGVDRYDMFPILSSASQDMILGELYQIQYSDIDLINIQHYLNIIELKTARFMAACAKLGSVIAGMSNSESDIMYDFGLKIGFAFQIIDDTLDYMDNFDNPEKDTASDFLSGKITLPYLRLLEKSSSFEKDQLTEYARCPKHESFAIVKKMIQSSNTFEYCIEVAREYVRDAVSLLDAFPSSIYKESIINLTTFMIERRY